MARLIARPHPADEGGSVLVIAMMVMGVALSLALVIVGVSITSGRTSGQDRGRLTTIDAAEAGIDGAYMGIQTATLALPCYWPLTGTTDTKTYPYTTSAQATITYYNAADRLTCTGTTLPPGGSPTRAVIASTGTTETSAPGGAKQRKMEALVNLLSVGGNSLTKAIDGDRSVTISNNALIAGDVGPDADVFTNGNYSCENSPTFRGSIYALGSITMNNLCADDGDVWAHSFVLLKGNKTIGGDVRSATSTITADNNTNVNGILTATGDIQWPNSWPGNCTAFKCSRFRSPAVDDPPSYPFPILRRDAGATAFTAEGYLPIPQPAGVACGKDTGDWIQSNARSLAKTLLKTTCDVEFRSVDVSFANDFALFADGGITTTNQVTFRSSVPGSARSVYMVMPYENPCPPDVAPPAKQVYAMSTGNNFSSTSDVNLLWYSPCSISYGNSGGSYGAIYSGGTVTSSNAFTLHYKPITVYGLDPASAPTTYKVDIIYKREDRVN
jgi:Tfp pilus assembly protein PilX